MPSKGWTLAQGLGYFLDTMMVLLNLICLSLLAAPPALKLPAELQKIEKKYAKASTLRAKFTQVTWISSLNQTKTATGVLQFKRPDKIRWEELTPNPSLLASNGKIFSFYTPPFDATEKGQLIERRTQEMTSQLVNSLLAGSFSRVKGLQIKGIGQSRFEVTPAKGTAGPVLNAKIVIDPKEGVITQVTLENKGGNRSEVTLSDIVLGQPIEDLIFEFKAPPNTDLIRD